MFFEVANLMVNAKTFLFAVKYLLKIVTMKSHFDSPSQFLTNEVYSACAVAFYTSCTFKNNCAWFGRPVTK